MNLNNYKNFPEYAKNNEEESDNLLKFKIDMETKKKIQVTRFLNTMVEGDKYNQEMINQMKLKEMNNKKILEDQIFQTKAIRAQMKPEILSKVTHDVFKSEFNISLIQGQPLYFNYDIFNDSNNEELFNIIINKVNKIKDNNNEIDKGEKELFTEGKIVSVVNVPEEWARIVNSERLEPPNDYNIFSNDLYFALRPNEH